MFSAFLRWLRSFFFTRELEISLIGLQNSGKTSLVQALTGGDFTSDSIPTVGFNLRKVMKGSVTIKLWDIGGQPRFRSMWERYCRGVAAIVFVVDSADPDTFAPAKAELQALLEKPQLFGIPILVLANKNDLEGHTKVKEMITLLQLDEVRDRELSIYSVSAKSKRNIDLTLEWLLKRG